jgi:hypothetical protein
MAGVGGSLPHKSPNSRRRVMVHAFEQNTKPNSGGILTAKSFAARARIAFAFSTNVWFDPHLAISSPDNSAAKLFVAELSAICGLSWAFGASSPRVDWADDESSGALIFPNVLAQCELDDSVVRTSCADAGFEIRTICVELCDLGFAAATLDLRSTPRQSALTSAYLDDVVRRARGRVEQVVGDLLNNIAQGVSDRWLSISRDSFVRLVPRPPVQPNKIMWSVKALVINPNDSEAGRRVHAAVATLMPGTFSSVTVGKSRYHMGNLVCIGVTPDLEGRDADALFGVTATLHRWWSGTWLLDAMLLYIFSRSRDLLSNRSVSNLETLQDDLGRLRRLASGVPARIDTYLLAMTGREYAVWSALANVWALENNLRAVERKSLDLALLIDSAATAARRQREQLIAQVLAIFAAVSVVASVIGLAAFILTQSLLDHESIILRIAIASASVTVVTLTFWLVHQSRRYRRRKRQTE